MSEPLEKPVTGAGCLLRSYWMLAGNALIALLGMFIAEQKGFTCTYRDILFWLATGSVIAARYWDIRHLGGQTAEGKPATLKQWMRYAVVLGVVALLLWSACHLVAASRV